jgi:hypothetical protein
MKSTFIASFSWRYLSLFSLAVQMMRRYKLRCTQPDFTVNKMVGRNSHNAGAIVTQYTYDDIIEAYVVSVMKTVIF